MDPIVDIVKHVVRARYEDLPKEAVEVTKKAIIDTIGSGIAGSSAPLGKMVADQAREWGGKKQSTVFVYGDRVAAPEAAFANSVMSRCRELDDVHEGNPKRGGGHGGHVHVMIVPGTLAMVESSPKPVTGKKLILALALGGDLTVRLRLAAGEAGRVGWMSETMSPFGVAAAGAKLFDLSEDVTASSMEAAFSFCSGSIHGSIHGTWGIWTPAGIGARGGVVAVDLARRGYVGAGSPLLTGAAGLYPLYFRNEFHKDILLSGLGEEFEGANASIKPYSCCKCTHHAIYTTLELMKKHGITAGQVKSIKVRTCAYNMWLVVLNDKGEHKYAPRNLNEAQFSMPFTMATAMIKGTVFPDIFTDDILKDAEVLALARKITVESTPEKDEIMKKQGFPPDDVDIYTTDGKMYPGCEEFVKGHPRNPMSFADLEEKFHRCAKLSAKPIAEEKMAGFLKQAQELEELEDVRGLVAQLS
ncbi:MAG: MmgE/PrpD family protein [Chloroflexota bacterium]